MTITRANPYVGFGTVVQPPRLAGRHAELDKIVRRVEGAAGSVALVGEPKVGKSSLAEEVLRRVRDRDDGTIAVIIDLSAAGADADLFEVLREELPLANCEGRGQSAGRQAYGDVKRSLELDAAAGRRYLVLLDEFDAVRSYRDANTSVRRLREIVSRPAKYGLGLVMTSRRRISQIEFQIPNLSTLVGVCTTVFVGPLDPAGIDEMIGRHWPDGLDVASRGKLDAVAGGHPYLMEALLFEMADGATADEAIGAAGELVRWQFGRLVALLAEDGVLEAARALARGDAVGPSDELEILLAYGIAARDRDGDPVLWSAAFRDHLRASTPIVLV